MEDFSFSIVRVIGMLRFLLVRTAAPACSFRTTNAASCFHNLLIGST